MEANVNNDSGPGNIKYVRPLDRSPEKNFSQRTEEEKKMICYSRSLKAKVRDKIERLENEVEEREVEVEKERKLRQEAEQRLKTCLQDMYNSKEVNQELRDRLPRANKSDPFKKEENVSETDLSSIEEQIVVEEEDSLQASNTKLNERKSQKRDGDSGRKTSRKSSPKRTPKQSPKSSPQSSRRTLDFSKDGRGSSENMASTQTGLERSNTFPYSNMSPPLRGFFGHSYPGASPAGPFMPFSSPLLSGSYPGLAAGFSNPLLHSTSVFQPPPNRPSLFNGAGASPDVASTSANMKHKETSPLGAINNLSVTTTTVSSFPLSSLSSSAAGGKLAGSETALGASGFRDSGIGQTNFSQYYQQYFPTQQTRHTSLLPDPPFLGSGSFRHPIGIGTSHLENNGHISGLLAEIDTLRQEIRKLKCDLDCKENEIETLKLTMKAKGVEQTAEPSKLHEAADVVEEVYAAQKKRDEATAARMKVVSEERDEMVARLHQLEERLYSNRDEASFFLQHSDDDLALESEHLEQEEMNILLSRLDSPSCSEQEAATFARRVELMRQRQREVTQEEMQIVMEQRDIALAKCRKLEEELLQYQKASDADGGMDTSLKAKLHAIQQERDLAVAKSKQLDDEIQTLRIYYSLHKSLSFENSYRQQANDSVISVQEELKVTKQQLEASQKENGRLVAQLRTVTFDKKQLEQALESVNQDKERLQRLANVLKRKLNNLTSDGTDQQ